MKKLKVGDIVWVKRHDREIPVEVREVPNDHVVKVRYPGVPELVTVSRGRIVRT